MNSDILSFVIMMTVPPMITLNTVTKAEISLGIIIVDSITRAKQINYFKLYRTASPCILLKTKSCFPTVAHRGCSRSGPVVPRGSEINAVTYAL